MTVPRFSLLTLLNEQLVSTGGLMTVETPVELKFNCFNPGLSQVMRAVDCA
jgi:hypothetical protein